MLLGNLELNNIYHMDCVEGMKLLPEGTNEIGIDLIIADPPYNFSNHKSTLDRAKYDGQLRNKYFGDWDMNFEQTSWLDSAYKSLRKGGQMIIFNGFVNFGEIINHFSNYKDVEIKRQLVWKKTNPLPANRDRLYVNSMEFMIWIIKGRGWTFNRIKDNYETGYFEYSSVMGKERIHPNQKPLGLISELVKIHSNENEIILDPFMGSATTAVAATLNKRKWIGFELESEYIELANKRLDNIELK